MLISCGSNHKFWWKCSKGHEWIASVNERVSHGTGCPYCSGNKLLIGTNDLQTLNPDLLLEWDYEKNIDIIPSKITANNGRKVWWKCKNGHEWLATIYSRNKGRGCPYCSGRLAIINKNDLLTTHPQLAREWLYEKNDFSPQEIKAGSNKVVWWKCSKGHQWQAQVKSRTQGSGCPYCSGKMVLIGFNDLETTNPELAKEWSYIKNANLTPQDVTAGSGRKVWWTCSHGHTWEALISSRTRGNGCPYCSKRYAIKGINDIKTTNPEVAFYWDYEKNKEYDIYNFLAGSEKVVFWKCTKGHSWQNMIRKQVSNNKCPICFPNKEIVIKLWREKNPNGTKSQCSKETGISSPTVRKYWKN